MGVFMGTQFSDSETTWIYIQDVENGFSILGHNRGMLANRVSYWFNSYGPSYSFHSGDTCGIEGLSIAYDAIKKGYCETALVGTAAFAMHPEMSFHYKGLGILSEDGYNRSFDDDANGFVRSEALVVMYLQKAKDAKRIYASIVHSHAECYGDRKAGYIVPLEYPMTNMLRNFYQQCGIDPTTVSYLEADGSGIKARDAAELNAISNVLLRDKQLPLLIGSIKSNLGHASASAALVSIVKVLISMEAGKIPPNYNFNKPSKKIPALVEGKLKVVTEAEPWPGGLAAVNSVGLTGVYGHILLRSHSKEKVNSGLPEDDLPRLLVISGRTEEGLNDTLNKLESQPVDVECVRLLHDLYSSDIINFSYRGYTLIGGHDTYRDIKHYDGMKRPLWFIFSGMGSQWQEMGSKIIQIPIIFESIQKSHNTLKGKGIDLLHIITTTDKDIFDNILHSMVGITAIQIALVDFMRALNIIPDGYIGHSVGELGCAYMDGCFTAEETLLAAYYRGLASNETELIPGYMAAIGLGHKEIKVLCPPEVDVACHNSINSSTISGPEHIVIQFVNDLKKKDIFARAVNVANIAYHSRYIQPAAPKLLRYLKQLITDPKPRSSKWISSSVPESEWDTPLAKYSSPEYHTNNLLKEVLFEESTTHIPNNAIVIEIAPHGLLQAILRRSFGSECIHIPLTLRGHPNSAEFLLTAVGKMYEAGLLPKVSSLYAPVHYPVSRGTASLSSLMTWDHKDTYLTAMDMNTGRLGGFNHYVDQSVTINLNQKQFRLLEGHKISGKAILPLSYLLFMTWKYYCSKQKIYISETSVVFQNLQVHQHLVIPEKGGFTLSVFIQQGSGFFEIEMDGITLILSGQIVQPQNIKQEFDKYMTVSPDVFSLTAQEVYSELKNRGYQYTDQFRGILDLTTTQKGCVATVNWADNWCCFIDSLIQMVLFIDGENSHDIYLPLEIRKAVIDPSQHKEPRDIKAVYNNLSGVVRGGGVEIQGLKVSATKTLKNNEASLKLESMTFLSHTNPRLKLTEQFVEVSMQIAFENISIPTTHKATIVDFEEESSLGNFTSVVKNILKKFHILKAEVKTVSLTNIKTITSPSSSLVLVITPISKLDQSVALLDGSSPFILARCPNQQKHKIHQDLVVVLQQQFNKEKLLLLRKAVTVVEKESVIKLTGDESTWLEQIKFAVDNGNGDSSRVYVVTNSKPQRKVRTLIQEICKETKAKKLRYVLLIDKNAPDFCLTKDIYQHQLQQDLLFNFYVDGSWGSFQQLPINALPEASLHISVLPTLRIKHIQINFVGLNLRDSSIHDDSKEMGINDVGHLEIAGVTDDGRRVMSVVQNNEDVSQKYLDTYLTWDIPDSWSLEDAVTVPLAYATAYHCLIQTALLKSEETVLIHAGHTPIGQAVIALALHIGSTVFTTVTEIIHKEFLMKRFPQNDDTSLHNLDVASRSLDSLSYFVSLIDKFGEDISESRIKADLPILNVQWSHGIKVSNYEGLENLLPSNLQELEGVGFDFLSKPKRPFSLVPSLSSGIGYAPEVLPIFIVPDKLIPFILTHPANQSCGELGVRNCSSRPKKATSKLVIHDS
uniref:Fatty acid synthase n=1 Tax=Timema monikensis TaxID=170555 RepID=A0A7R9HR93_9NEOP|nr:unnamed protein product [Timema monikensis]